MFKNMRVIDNVELKIKKRGMERRKRKRIESEEMERVRIEDFEDRSKKKL